MIGVDHHFGSCFACSVGVSWGKDAGFLQLIFAMAHFAINFVSRHVDEPFNAGLLGALQKNVRAIDVRVGEAIRVAKAQIHMRLSCKVHHRVNVIALHAVEDFGGICQVAMVKSKVALVIEGSSVVQSRAVIELVKRYNVVSVRVCQGEMANNPGST